MYHIESSPFHEMYRYIHSITNPVIAVMISSQLNRRKMLNILSEYNQIKYEKKDAVMP